MSKAWISSVVIPFLMGLMVSSIRSQSVTSSGQDAQTSAPEQVKVIIDRCIARDYSIVSGRRPDGQVVEGVTRISWVQPTAEDYRAIASIGQSAIEPLYMLLDDTNSFRQLLAVRFLTAIGGTEAEVALVHATSKGKWQVTRMSAMASLARSSSVDKLVTLKALQTDDDPLVAKRARDLVDGLTQNEAKH